VDERSISDRFLMDLIGIDFCSSFCLSGGLASVKTGAIISEKRPNHE
jgi:hypothetical protein